MRVELKENTEIKDWKGWYRPLAAGAPGAGQLYEAGLAVRPGIGVANIVLPKKPQLATIFSQK